jgi:hypothetical protein
MVTFSLTPKTVQAGMLVDRVVEAVEAWEATAGARTRKRTEKAASSFRIALASIIAAAALSADDGTAGRIFRSMSEARWDKADPVGFLTMKTAFDGLAGASLLVKVKPGYFRRYFEGSAGQGKAARWQATPRLRSLITASGIAPGHARDHFAIARPSDPIVVRAAKERTVGGRRIVGESLPVPDTPKAKKLRAELEELDTFLARHTLQGGSHDGYKRVFNDGDVEGFLFDRGGRLQSIGAKSYQSLPSVERLNMRIDGDPVVEIDIRSCQLSILHAVYYPKRELPVDPYTVEPLPREVVKGWITVALGKQGIPARWPSDWISKLKELGITAADYPIKAVGARMVQQYPFLDRLPDLWPATKLQYFESSIIIAAMLRLVREYDIPSLAMHDGIIVREKDEGIACRTLEAEFKRRMRVNPRLSVDRYKPLPGR